MTRRRNPSLTGEQIRAVFCRVMDDPAFDRIAVAYSRSRQPLQPLETPIGANLFRWACYHYLQSLGTEIATWRKRAEAIEAGLQALREDPPHFGSLMATGDGGACAQRALWAMETVARDLRWIVVAETRGRGLAFFARIGAEFRKAQLPLPTATHAVAANEALRAAFKAERISAPLGNYDARENGTAIRRALRG